MFLKGKNHAGNASTFQPKRFDISTKTLRRFTQNTSTFFKNAAAFFEKPELFLKKAEMNWEYSDFLPEP